MGNSYSLFLRQSYLDAWEDYRRSLHRADFPVWDYIILTASNEAQANAYRQQIAIRRAKNLLPARTHYAVLPDPDGLRVGSGGATLNALRYVCTQEGTFAGKRILCIHSGGDSKRVPQYSACGKLFSPVPRELPNGRRSTLFDEFIIGMSGVPSRIRDGMLVLSGDVLLLFNPLQIDAPASGAAAISFKEDVETGKNHGVFQMDEQGNVGEFLHKQTVETLTSRGAVNAQGKVDIDTGAVLFSADLLADLYTLVDTPAKFAAFVNDRARLSFYGDFLYPLASRSTLEQFYREKPDGSFTEELHACRTAIWQVLRKYRMRLLRLAPASFIHFGTTHELRALMTDGVSAYSFLDWKKCVSGCCSSANYWIAVVAVGVDGALVAALEQSRSGALVKLGCEGGVIGAGSSGDDLDGNAGLLGIGGGELLPSFVSFGLEVQVVDRTGRFGRGGLFRLGLSGGSLFGGGRSRFGLGRGGLFGLCGLGLGCAGSQAKNHHERQKHCDDLFHGISS